jgi:SOS response regulatory protein OraA/RecX
MGTLHQRQTFIERLNNNDTDNISKQVLFYIRQYKKIDYNKVIDYFWDTRGRRTSSTGAAFSKLLDMGLIKEVEIGMFSYVEDETEQKELWLKRMKDKRAKWEKKGYEEGWFDLWKFENGYVKKGN